MSHSTGVVEGEVVCGAEQGSCICILDPHDERTPHECSCRGSWREIDGKFEVFRWPHGLDEWT